MCFRGELFWGGWLCGAPNDSRFKCDLHVSSSNGGYILSKLTVGLEITLEVLLHHYTLTYQIGMWYYVGNVMVDTWCWVIELVTFQDTQRDQLCWFHQKRE